MPSVPLEPPVGLLRFQTRPSAFAPTSNIPSLSFPSIIWNSVSSPSSSSTFSLSFPRALHRVKTTKHVRPVAVRTRTPDSPRARSASAQNSAGRASARTPAPAPSKNQSEVSRTPRKAVIPASGPARSTVVIVTEVPEMMEEMKVRRASPALMD